MTTASLPTRIRGRSCSTPSTMIVAARSGDIFSSFSL
jgi:hypothetical protein